MSITASPPNPLASRHGHVRPHSPEPAQKPASPFSELMDEAVDGQPAPMAADPSPKREAGLTRLPQNCEATSKPGDCEATSKPGDHTAKKPDPVDFPPSATGEGPVEAQPVAASLDEANPQAPAEIVPAQQAKADTEASDSESPPVGAAPEIMAVAVAIPAPAASVPPIDPATRTEHGEATGAPAHETTVQSVVPPPTMGGPGDPPAGADAAEELGRSAGPAPAALPAHPAATTFSATPDEEPAFGAEADAAPTIERVATAKPQGPSLQAPSSPPITKEAARSQQQEPALAVSAPRDEKAPSRSETKTEGAEARPGVERLATALHAATDEPAPLPANAAIPGGHDRVLIQIFTGAGAHAAAPAAQPPTPLAVPIAGVAVEIAAQALAGKNRFEIRLDPPELGRIDVRLDVDRDGRVTSRMVVERPETLHLLRRDAPQLERALQDAGLKTGDNAMQFSLRDQGSGQQDARPEPLPRAAHIVLPAAEAPPTDAALGYGRSFGRAGALDIRV